MKDYLKKLMGLFFLIFRILVDLFRMIYIFIALVIAAFWGLLCIVRRSDTINPIPESSRKPSDPLTGKVYYRGVKHKDVLAAMDPQILAYFDPSLPQYRCEYSRTKARLMGKSDDLNEKNARKVKNLNSQIDDLEKRMNDLKNLMILKFDQAVTNRKKKRDIAKFFKSKMSSCLSRSDFNECYLKPFLKKRYGNYTEDKIDHNVRVLQKEFDDKLESCIKSLKSKLDCKKSELEIYKS